MNFRNIIGNDGVKELLNNSISTNSVLHSYMFVGPDGIGKKLFAIDFSEMILCLNDNKACGNCDSCVKFSGNSHPDFEIVDSEDGKSIKIGQIRLLQEQIAEKPIVSDKKIYIINNADLMTTEAQNCLLKTLEEPPEYAVIILILSNETKLLNTIKSRCTKIHFQKLSNEDLIEFAQKNNVEFKQELLNVCDGSISKLLSLKDNMVSYNMLDTILKDLYSKDIVDIWNEADILYKSKDNISSLLDYFNTIFLKKLRSTNDGRYIIGIKIVEETKKRLAANANYDMSIDNLLLKLWEELHEGNIRS